MSARTAPISPYRSMWLFVMFDLPVMTENERKKATRFRADLLDRGFQMSQFSIYLRHCASPEIADAETAAIKRFLPPKGRVHVLPITDKQYEKMSTFHGISPDSKRQKPEQFELF